MALSAPSVLLTSGVHRQTLMFAGKVQEVELPAVTSRKGQIKNLTESFPSRLLVTAGLFGVFFFNPEFRQTTFVSPPLK